MDATLLRPVVALRLFDLLGHGVVVKVLLVLWWIGHRSRTYVRQGPESR